MRLFCRQLLTARPDGSFLVAVTGNLLKPFFENPWPVKFPDAPLVQFRRKRSEEFSILTILPAQNLPIADGITI